MIQTNLDTILFLDIETVPQQPSFDELDSTWQDLWAHKIKKQLKDDITPADLYNDAGLYAEFGRIVCISCGYVIQKGNERRLHLKSYFGEDEYTLLGEFATMLTSYETKRPNLRLCAHNGKEFDFPFIARRMLINGIALPKILNVAGCKPWETPFIDTMELWRFGDYKSFTSLKLLTQVFGIPSPKDDIDGSQVASTFWNDGDLNRIVRYCEKDVQATVQLMMRYEGLPLFADDKITSVTQFDD